MFPSSVPKGGLILVTGANGYIASVTIQVFLQRGYRVRGTVRSATSSAWMKRYFGSEFELIEVPDINSHGAFDYALKGVDGIAHIAMNMAMDPHNQGIIEDTIKSNLDLLQAAARAQSVKSVVFTSSVAACVLPRPGTPYKITTTTWNTEALGATTRPWDGQGNPRWHGITLYGASKARGEQEAFAWVAKHKPAFSFNTVIPNVVFGTAVSPQNMGYRSTAAVLDAVIKGYPGATSITPSQWYVDVEDVALLHLAALTVEEVRGERLIAFAGKYTWMQILEILHRRYPGRIGFVSIDGEEVADVGEVDNARSIELLKLMGKGAGFTSLENTLVRAVDTILQNGGKNVPKTRIDLYYEEVAKKQAEQVV
ncbi:hypothetical protein BJY01DRAFT_256720 [Aspergillus pseudoustus]|uniref:NAD-dependent epimerase/dehydratase domain-containing protein n=1 Tax=Aspergillus pseudoustus TaxID=1810923 RepID=A0ABR4L507_9EURO